MQKEDNNYQSLIKTKSQKEQKLEELKNSIINDTVDLSQITELLKNQEEVLIKESKEESSKRLEITKRTILRLKTIGESEINQLCQLQSEITTLELKLQENHKQQTKQIKQISQVINNYYYSGTFNAPVLSDIINTGDNTNFGTIGIQNNASVREQHNYPSEAKIQQNTSPNFRNS